MWYSVSCSNDRFCTSHLIFALDNSTWVDVKETDGTDTSYTVSAGDVLRVDPSGWAFASNGYIRVTSDGTEAADRSIILHFRHS